MFRVSHILVQILLVALYCTYVSSYPLELNCTYFQRKVPKPQLKYLLSGHLHVNWQENETIGYNYTAHICCSKLWPFPYLGCPNTCPQFQAITSCTSVDSRSDSRSRQCSMIVYENFEYTVYLRGKQHGCQLMGEMVKIKPRQRIAYPDPVPLLNVYTMSNGLVIEWTKPHKYVQLSYSLICKQHDLIGQNDQTVLTERSRTNVLKQYSCCVRVRLPLYGRSPYYSEVCKNSQNKEITSELFQCGSLHECKTAEVDDLRYFTGQIMPDDKNWPNMPPAMVIEIKKRNPRPRKKNPLTF